MGAGMLVTVSDRKEESETEWCTISELVLHVAVNRDGRV